MRPNERSWRDACISILVGAIAVYVAVRLIEAVWVVLVAIAAVAACVMLAVALVRNRKRGW